jgi:hypothetical protein
MVLLVRRIILFCLWAGVAPAANLTWPPSVVTMFGDDYE